MKARTFVRKTYPQAYAKREVERTGFNMTVIARDWVITYNFTVIGTGKTKTEAWEDARTRIEKNVTPEEERPLSKQEAIQRMREGKKVTHDYFTDDEYMWLEDGMYYFEDGVKCPICEFWKYRSDEKWNTGWYEYTLKTEKMKIS